MMVRALLSTLLLVLAPPAFAQREVEAAKAEPFRSAIQSQARGTDRFGMKSSTRDMLPPGDRAQAERMMRRFAQCVVRGDEATALRLLATAAGSREERTLMTRIATGRAGCLEKGRLRMKGNWMRGAIAEQLYLNIFPDPAQGVAQPDAPLPPGAGQGATAYQAYARCIVARNAPAADAVLRAAPGSAAEKTAYRQTMPVLSSCLSGGEGATLAIDRSALRGLLAEALYERRSAGRRG